MALRRIDPTDTGIFDRIGLKPIRNAFSKYEGVGDTVERVGCCIATATAIDRVGKKRFEEIEGPFDAFGDFDDDSRLSAADMTHRYIRGLSYGWDGVSRKDADEEASDHASDFWLGYEDGLKAIEAAEKAGIEVPKTE